MTAAMIRRRRIGRSPVGGLFADGSNGIFRDFSRTNGLFTDSAGTVQLVAPAQTVGMMWDGSRVRVPRTDHAGVQANVNLQPKWGRAPLSWRNRAAGSSALTDITYWPAAPLQSGLTATISNQTTDINGLPQCDIRLAGTSSGTSHNLSYASAQSRTRAVQNEVFTASFRAQVIAGTLTGFSGVSAHIIEETAAFAFLGQTFGTGFSSATEGPVTATRTMLGATAAIARTSLYFTFTSGVAIDVTFRIKGLQFEKAGDRTAYQFSTSPFDFTETGFASHGFIRPDLSDDVLTTTLTLAQTGDVAIFGRLASKIESGIVYGAGATLSLGPTTVTGMSAGVLAAVGDVIGMVAIGKAVTAADRASVLAWFQARGAGAWI